MHSRNPGYPLEHETEDYLDLLIRIARANHDLNDVDFENLPPKDTSGGPDAVTNVIRRATKKALIKIKDLPLKEWLGKEIRTQVLLAWDIMRNTQRNALILLRFDGKRNVVVRFEGITIGDTPRFPNRQKLLNHIVNNYGIRFKTNSISYSRGKRGPVVLPVKRWSLDDLMLLDQAMSLMGAVEKSLIRGMGFRRINRASCFDTIAYYDTQDKSINLMDDAMRTSMDVWAGEGITRHSGGVMTLLHEIGHALSYRWKKKPRKTYLRLFKETVMNEVRRRKGQPLIAPSRLRMPRKAPGKVIEPSEYAETDWDEFFAETYSIFKTNPSFLNITEHQYLYDFFNKHMP